MGRIGRRIIYQMNKIRMQLRSDRDVFTSLGKESDVDSHLYIVVLVAFFVFLVSVGLLDRLVLLRHYVRLVGGIG